MVRTQLLMALAGVFLSGSLLAEPPPPPGPNNKPMPIGVRMLDGEWKYEGRGMMPGYDISDVEVDDDIATFSTERKRRHQHGGGGRFGGGPPVIDDVTCNGVGQFEFKKNLVVITEVCPPDRRFTDWRLVSQLTLKLVFQKEFNGGKLVMKGKEQEQYVSAQNDVTVNGWGGAENVTLVREQERPNGPRWRRGGRGGGGGGPRPGWNGDSSGGTGLGGIPPKP